jgi:hypothetical protein
MVRGSSALVVYTVGSCGRVYVRVCVRVCVWRCQWFVQCVYGSVCEAIYLTHTLSLLLFLPNHRALVVIAVTSAAIRVVSARGGARSASTRWVARVSVNRGDMRVVYV